MWRGRPARALPRSGYRRERLGGTPKPRKERRATAIIPRVPQPVLIFANPIAGRGMGHVIAQRLAARLSRDGFDARTIFKRADQVSDDAIPRDTRAAIAIGGDGTVRGVAIRLMKSFA